MKRSPCLQIALATMLLLLSALAWADTSVLKPPKGSKIALVVFEDLECPMCAKAAPLLHEAAKKYDIPLVQYDFPLRQHPWSYDAAVNARFFDTKSPKLGDEYRLYIFQNQNSITKGNLRGITERWAEEHKITLPFIVDPSGELAGKIETDRKLGERVPLDHTPTIYIVNDSGHGAAVTEVPDITQLYQKLDEVVKVAGPTMEAHKKASPQPRKSKAQ